MTSPDATLASSTVGTWLERLAEPVPNPGGGAAAALALAAGSALVQMSAGYAEEGSARSAAEKTAAHARSAALAAADEDAAHSGRLAEAFHLAEDDPRRAPLLRERMLAAAISGRDVAEIVRPLRATLESVAGMIPPLLSADVVVAARLLAAGVRASAANARSNVSAALGAGAAGDQVGSLRASEAAALELAAAFDAIATMVSARL